MWDQEQEPQRVLSGQSEEDIGWEEEGLFVDVCRD